MIVGIITGEFFKNPYMEVDMGNIPFPIQTHKTHTWVSCTNLINGILPLMVFKHSHAWDF